MLDTKTKILNAATECFFQHGFNTANISMISRHSGISRVTIHKQFSSKEQLFSSVVSRYAEIKHESLSRYIECDKEFWLSTTQLLLENCEQLFVDISSSAIRADLMHAAHKLCQGVIDTHRANVRQAITQKLQQAIHSETISLDKIALTTSELAYNLESIFFSLMSANNIDNLSGVIRNTIAVYQVATDPSST